MTSLLARRRAMGARTTADGRYAIDEIVGEGGMGRVYRGRHLGLGIDVALKALLPGAPRQPEAAERLAREARLGASVSHPSLGAVIDLGEDPALGRYLVMPFYEGESLRARLDRDGALPWRDAVRACASVASALAVLHDAGFCHRDVKPSNVILGLDGTVRLVDLGIAAALPMPGGPEDLTPCGHAVVSAGYSAPECYIGREASVALDVYALGVVLFEALVGRRPFRGVTVREVLRRQLEGPPSLHEARPELEVPPTLERTVEALMAPAPAARPASMRCVVEALERALAAPSPERAQPARLGVARRRIGLAVAHAVLGAATGVGVAHLVASW